MSLLLYAAAVVTSGLPNLWAYAAFHAIADHLLILLGFAQFVLAVAIAFAIKVAWPGRAHAAHESAASPQMPPTG